MTESVEIEALTGTSTTVLVVVFDGCNPRHSVEVELVERVDVGPQN